MYPDYDENSYFLQSQKPEYEHLIVFYYWKAFPDVSAELVFFFCKPHSLILLPAPKALSINIVLKSRFDKNWI